MNNKIKNEDSAFDALLEIRQQRASNLKAIAEHQREINKIEGKDIADQRTERVFAANYFTADKIRELHKRTLEVLKCDDFDQDFYIDLFSNSSTIDDRYIDFLVNRKKELDEFEQTFDNIKGDLKVNKSSDFLLTLAEIFRGGSANDD